MSKLTIFRGLPGSGKTTRARELAAATGAILIEPDSLMITDGVYNYTPIRYLEARFRCIQAIYEMTHTCTELKLKWSLAPDIIYADVLPCRQNIDEIIAAAQWPDNVEVIDCVITVEESKLRNRHNVNPADIDRMAAQWQPWPKEN